MIGIGVPAGSREAQAGNDLAQHAAAHGIRTMMYAPHSARRNSVNLLHLRHRPNPYPDLLERDLAAFDHRPPPVELLVIDSFHQLSTTDGDSPILTEEHAGDAGRQLKMLAGRSPGKVAIVVMAHLHCRSDQEPLEMKQLGLAAELEYDADTLLLMRRSTLSTVDLLVVKDRFGPAPQRTTVEL